MISVERSIIINKPVQEVFAFVTAEGNHRKIQPEVSEVIEHGSRNTVGSSYTEVRKFMGQEMRTTIEVTAFEPNVKWVGKVIKGPVFYELTTTYEASNGGTRFTTKMTGETRGFFKLAENLVVSQLEKTITENNAGKGLNRLPGKD
jgi:ligand-binding SRPBCC domain-containing protein